MSVVDRKERRFMALLAHAKVLSLSTLFVLEVLKAYPLYALDTQVYARNVFCSYKLQIRSRRRDRRSFA